MVHHQTNSSEALVNLQHTVNALQHTMAKNPTGLNAAMVAQQVVLLAARLESLVWADHVAATA